MSNWSELPGELLELIANKLIYITDHVRFGVVTTDYIRFGAVCVSWRSAYVYRRPACISWRSPFTERHLPLLMIPSKENKETRSLYCLMERRVLDFHLPVPHDKSCRGSTHGWLVTVDEKLAVHLLNPFSTINNEIHLPPLTAFSKIHENDPIDRVGNLTKAVLSSNPTSTPSYAVVIIYGGWNRLAISKPGDKAWTSFDFEWSSFRDVIFYKCQVYAVEHKGRVVVFDVGPFYPTVTKIIEPPTDEIYSTQSYLVESSGELLQVKRDIRWWDEDMESDGDGPDEPVDKILWSTVGFQVFKLDQFGSKWIEVKSLLDRVIFVGDNTSMSLSASDFPGCKPNCIYFTDDKNSYSPEFRHHDMGVFNLECGCIEPHYPIHSEWIMPAPIWVEPMLLSRG